MQGVDAFDLSSELQIGQYTSDQCRKVPCPVGQGTDMF